MLTHQKTRHSTDQQGLSHSDPIEKNAEREIVSRPNRASHTEISEAEYMISSKRALYRWQYRFHLILGSMSLTGSQKKTLAGKTELIA